MGSEPRLLDIARGSRRVRRLDLDRFRVSEVVFASGFRLPSHHHQRGCVSVILEGHFLERFGRRECRCPPGSVLTKPPGETHEDRWFEGTARHLVIEPDETAHESLGECAQLVEAVFHARDPGVALLARRILQELRVEDSGQALAVEGLALELMVRVLRGPRDDVSHNSPPEWLLQSRDLLHDRFLEDVRLDELADVAGVHPSHLCRTFSRYFGIGPAGYQRRLRLEAARRELAETDYPISRIALRNGFSDQSHLTRVLKDATGLTPARYRRLHR